MSDEEPEQTVTYDRDEWRRPWRTGEGPSTPPALAPPDDGPSVAGPTEAEPQADTPAHADPAQPSIARFPQPPPAGWSESSAGPGSPAGSVRPPDTTGTVEAPAKERRGPRLLAIAAVAFVGAIVGALVTLAAVLPREEATPTVTPPPQTEAPDDVAAPTIEIDGEINNIIPAVAQAVSPSVVQIEVIGEGTLGVGQSVGSGVIYRSDGYIMTNHHVIDGAEQVRVRLSNGDLLDAEIIGSDELNDLAVVRVERDGLPAINLRPEDEPLVVGETVVAIGSPFRLDGTVTAGIVSGLNREIPLDEEQPGAGRLTIPSVIQTDAAINPGNSGGPLVDAQGRLVGINTAILTRTGGSQGVGFAVPADQAISSADQLIEQGFVRHPLLGITGYSVTPEIAEEFDLESPRGAVIDSVQEGTGAADADLRVGDTIVAIDGDTIATMSEVVAEIRRREPGDLITLSIVRDGEAQDVEVELGERPRQ